MLYILLSLLELNQIDITTSLKTLNPMTLHYISVHVLQMKRGCTETHLWWNPRAQFWHTTHASHVSGCLHTPTRWTDMIREASLFDLWYCRTGYGVIFCCRRHLIKYGRICDWSKTTFMGLMPWHMVVAMTMANKPQCFPPLWRAISTYWSVTCVSE